MDYREHIAYALCNRVGSAPPERRIIAVGTITRHAGRTTTVRVTEAGVTGSIRPTGGAR